VASAVDSRVQRLLGSKAVARPAHPQTLPHVTHVAVLDRLRLIARTLEDEPGLTARELGERVGFGRRHMSLLLLRLEEHGHVAHEGRRWFPGGAPVARTADHASGTAFRRLARDPAKSRNPR
jgi:DNA-binding IclR family transcriptional regulator